MNSDFMKIAIKEAKKAADMGEIPVGAVVVQNGIIISKGRNMRESKKNALMHAEIVAIDRACKKLGGWRLFDCELYVTLEPCAMCAGAIINSRIKKVVYGAKDTRFGACGSVTNLFEMPFNHKPELISGILEHECSLQLKSFFKTLRSKV